jgi:hypothetical protein
MAFQSRVSATAPPSITGVRGVAIHQNIGLNSTYIPLVAQDSSIAVTLHGDPIELFRKYSSYETLENDGA